MRGESGNSALYTLLFLPVLLGFASIAVDLSSLSSTANTLQSELDRITLSAAHALPSPQARTIAETLVSERVMLPSKTFSVRATSSEIEISVSAQLKSSLFSIISQVFGNSGHTPLQVSAHSSAQLAPVDAVLILPDGPQMGVDLNFPPSQAISSCVHPPQSQFANHTITYLDRWETDPSFITSRCFNPLFSAVKELGIRLSEQLIAVGTNRLGVIFNDSGELVRSLPASGFNSYTAQFTDEVELETMFSDTLCALMASRRFGDTYALRSPHRFCEDVVETPPCGRPFNPGEGLSEECLHGSTVSEVIHHRFARSISRHDLNFTLTRAISELTDISNTLQQRGNRGDRPVRVIIAVVGTLPPPDEAAIAELKRHDIRLLLNYLGEPSLTSARWAELLGERVHHGSPTEQLAELLLKQVREVVLKS